jgi:type IV pilus assembly protein PilO
VNTTTQRIGVVAGVVAVLILGLWFMLLFRPEASDLTKAHQAKAAAEQKASQLQTEVSHLNALVKLIPQDQQTYTKLLAELPDNPQLPAAIDQLHADEASSGVFLQAINPSVPATAGSGTAASAGPPAITLTMTVSGTYQQELAFITALDQSPRVFVVDHVSLAGGGPTGMAMSLGVRMFYAGQPTP